MFCDTILQHAATAFAALFGAALGAFLTHRFSRNRDRLEMKRDVLRRLMGYRWQLTRGRKNPDGHIFTALNEILVVFAGDRDVEIALSEFHTALNKPFQPEHLERLAAAMAKSARVPKKGWSKELLERPFTPPDQD